MITSSAKLVNQMVTIGEITACTDALKANELGYMPRSLVAACLPHSRPVGNEYTHINGKFRISIIAPTDTGIPFGSRPRLIIAFLAGEAIRTKSRHIALGNSLSEFMRGLGIDATGGSTGSISRLKNQLVRLSSCTISTSWTDFRHTTLTNAPIVSTSQLWWTPHELKRNGNTSFLTLGHEFFEDVITRPVPVDFRALRILKRSSLALDIYCWLTYRMYYLARKGRTKIPWLALRNQFGGEYKSTPTGLKNFRQRFIQQLGYVLLVYQSARVEVVSDGIILIPSPTHVSNKTNTRIIHTY